MEKICAAIGVASGLAGTATSMTLAVRWIRRHPERRRQKVQARVEAEAWAQVGRNIEWLHETVSRTRP